MYDAVCDYVRECMMRCVIMYVSVSGVCLGT